MLSIHGHRIVNNETTIIVPRMTVTDQKTDGDRTNAAIYIATIDVEK